MKALSKFFVKFNFWQIWHLKLLNSKLNCQSHVLTARRFKYLARQISRSVHNKKTQQFDFLKNRFHSQLLPLNTHFWILLSSTSVLLIWLKPHFLSPASQQQSAKAVCSFSLNHALIALNDNRVIVNWFKYYNVNKSWIGAKGGVKMQTIRSEVSLDYSLISTDSYFLLFVTICYQQISSVD